MKTLRNNYFHNYDLVTAICNSGLMQHLISLEQHAALSSPLVNIPKHLEAPVKKIEKTVGKNEELKSLLSKKLDEHNSKFMFNNCEEISFRIIDDNKNTIAGITGEIYGHGLYIHLLWVDEKQRGNGLGEVLLKKAEEYALSSACKFITLDTYNFQAPDYYKNQGYESFGILDCQHGIRRIYMRKEI